jgi:hypothetical protein
MPPPRGSGGTVSLWLGEHGGYGRFHKAGKPIMTNARDCHGTRSAHECGLSPRDPSSFVITGGASHMQGKQVHCDLVEFNAQDESCSIYVQYYQRLSPRRRKIRSAHRVVGSLDSWSPSSRAGDPYRHVPGSRAAAFLQCPALDTLDPPRVSRDTNAVPV